MNQQPMRAVIEAAFESRQSLTADNAGSELRAAIDAAIGLLDRGELRVAEPSAGHWRVNEWLKKAVLLYFRTHDNQVSDAGYARFYDKVPLKYADAGCRAVRRAAACASCRMRSCAAAPTSPPTSC